MRYEIRRFEMVATGLLEPHPDAQAYPADEDDREIVRASTADLGTLQPLTVAEKPGGQGYWVLDGCGRLEAALRRQDAEVPCLVVECDDPRRLAWGVNAAGRKRSTGSRVLCYLMANRADVEAARKASEQTAVGGLASRDARPPRKGRSRNEMPPELQAWTVRGIAERLGVSDKDVAAALELLECHERGTLPSAMVHGRNERGTPMTQDCEFQAMDKAFTSVIAGRLPVRRWAAGFCGKVNLKGEGKAPTDWANVCDRAATSLRGALEHAAEIRWASPGQEQRTRENLAEVFGLLPDRQRHDLMDVIVSRWSDADRAALAKRLAGKGGRP